MAYSWAFNDEIVAAHFAALPGAAASALATLLDEVAVHPFGFIERSPQAEEDYGHSTSSGTLPFAGFGLVVVQVYEPDEAVYVKSIVWSGG